MAAEIDWRNFAAAVRLRLDLYGLSYGGAVAKWPDLNKGLLSRACNGKVLSAGNYVLVCQLMQFEAGRFLTFDDKPRVTLRAITESLQNQPVTAAVARETEHNPRGQSHG